MYFAHTDTVLGTVVFADGRRVDDRAQSRTMLTRITPAVRGCILDGYHFFIVT